MEGEQPDPLKTKTVSWLLITEPNWDDPPSNVPPPSRNSRPYDPGIWKSNGFP